MRDKDAPEPPAAAPTEPLVNLLWDLAHDSEYDGTTRRNAMSAQVRSAIQQAVEARDLEYTVAIMGAPGTGPMTPEKARLTLDVMKNIWTDEAVEREREEN